MTSYGRLHASEPLISGFHFRAACPHGPSLSTLFHVHFCFVDPSVSIRVTKLSYMIPYLCFASYHLWCYVFWLSASFSRRFHGQLAGILLCSCIDCFFRWNLPCDCGLLSNNIPISTEWRWVNVWAPTPTTVTKKMYMDFMSHHWSDKD